MKTHLLSAVVLFTLSANAQEPIAALYGENPASYTVMSSAAPLDESATGADLTWNFNSLTQVGWSVVENNIPSAGEVTNYPGTTNRISILNGTGGSAETTTTNIYVSVTPATNTTSITGLATTGLEINFIENATLGQFPMAYGYTNSDTSGGTYVYGEYSGVFSGTINTTVDAYGTLTTDEPLGEVIRLKTVQVLSMNYLFFENVGTFTQTINSYYDAVSSGGSPVFRTTTTVISIPMLEVNDTITTIERYGILLATDNPASAAAIKVVNPVGDLLMIGNPGNNQIHSVKILDTNGRTIAHQPYSENGIDVSNLSKGMYFAQLETDNGSFTKKIVKN